MSRLGKLLDQLEDYGFENAIGSQMGSVPPFVALRELAEDMDRVLAEQPVLSGAQKLVASRAAADPAVTRPFKKVTVILSELHDVPGYNEPLVIGWTTCARCLLHVVLCECAGGPLEPASVQKWRETSGHVPPKDVPTGVRTPARAEPAAAAVTPVVAVTDPPDQVCKVCGIEVATEGEDRNGDANDDGTFTCFADQAGAAERG